MYDDEKHCVTTQSVNELDNSWWYARTQPKPAIVNRRHGFNWSQSESSLREFADIAVDAIEGTFRTNHDGWKSSRLLSGDIRLEQTVRGRRRFMNIEPSELELLVVHIDNALETAEILSAANK